MAKASKDGAEWQELDYWRWFRHGYKSGTPGYKCIWNMYICYHLLVGSVLLVLVETTLKEAANTVLLPLSGILVGLSFAWAASAHDLLQSKQIQVIAKERAGGVSYYIFQFQTGIGVVIATVVLWGLAGLNVFDTTWPTTKTRLAYTSVSWLLYSMSSLAIREMWHLVHDVQVMLLMKIRLAEIEESLSADGDGNGENDGDKAVNVAARTPKTDRKRR